MPVPAAQAVNDEYTRRSGRAKRNRPQGGS